MRPRLYYMWNIPRSVVLIVIAICADYDRRKNAIENEDVSGRVLSEFERFNNVIDRALEDVEPGLRRIMLNDVANRKGYGNTLSSPFLAKNTYYNRKRKLVHDIAAGLGLIE